MRRTLGPAARRKFQTSMGFSGWSRRGGRRLLVGHGKHAVFEERLLDDLILVLVRERELALGAFGQGLLGGGDEIPEEWMGIGRTGAELRVKLNPDEEGMPFQLHDLGELSIRRGAADDEPGGGEPATEGVVDLETV